MARRQTLTEQAQVWIREQLAAGPVLASEMERRWRATGWITATTLAIAKARVGVVSRKSRESMGSWTWELPQE